MIWKTLDSKLIFDASPHFKLKAETVQTTGGKKIFPFYKLEGINFVVILPLTPDEKIVMVEQYRHGVGEMTLEIPAGSLEEGETSLEAGQRELQEETGYATKEFVRLASNLPSNPAMNTHRYDIFLARNAIKTGDQNLDESEEISIKEIPLTQAIEWAVSGRINHGPTIIAIFKTAWHLKQVDFCP